MWKDVHGTLTDRGRIAGETVRDMACRLTNDGDFQGCKFTPNSVLVVTWHNGRETRTRVTPLEALPDLADLCTDELPEYGDDDA